MKRGLTLIEITVVLIILGILTSIAIPIISASVRRAKLMDTDFQLQEIRVAILTYYLSKRSLPVASENNTVPTEVLGLPQTYKFDKLTGAPFYYYADTSSKDTVKIDNIPMGEYSVVLIARGFDGVLNNQDTLLRRFSSVGGNGFDDVISYVSELDLKGLFIRRQGSGSKLCDEYKLTIKNYNVQTYGDSVRLLHPMLPSYTAYNIPANSEFTIPITLKPATTVQLCENRGGFAQTRTAFFNIASYNEGDDCTIYIVLYSHLSTTTANRLPLISADLYR